MTFDTKVTDLCGPGKASAYKKPGTKVAPRTGSPRIRRAAAPRLFRVFQQNVETILLRLRLGDSAARLEDERQDRPGGDIRQRLGPVERQAQLVRRTRHERKALFLAVFAVDGHHAAAGIGIEHAAGLVDLSARRGIELEQVAQLAREAVVVRVASRM